MFFASEPVFVCQTLVFFLLIAGIKAPNLKGTWAVRLLWHTWGISIKRIHLLCTSAHAVVYICQITTPLFILLSLRIYFINTSWPFFCCLLQMPVGMPHTLFLFLLACLTVCKHKPIPLRCFSRLHFQVPAWDACLWWWAMCKAAFSNLIKGPRYSSLKQRALEAWRNDSGKSTALICKNLHLLAGRGDARRRGVE